jgi:hypothetical protein
MAHLIKIFFFVLTILLFNSCQKEYSNENPLSGISGIKIGANCIINKVTAVDTITLKGSSALNYNFNIVGDKILGINRVDSVTANTIFTSSPIYSGDTIRINGNQYFTLDANKRIVQLLGYEDPYDVTSNIFMYNYSYNNTGYLIKKTKSNPIFPTFIEEQTEYTYTNNNLTNIVTKLPLINTTILEVSIDYDLSKQPFNYFNVLPDCDELVPYIAVINMGIKSKNAASKITIKNFNVLTGTLVNTTTTNYINYKYSLDNYVLSVDANGYNIPAIPLQNGRNKFSYFCK